MKHTFTLYAEVLSADGAFLVEVAIALGAYRLRPEALTWSLVGPIKVKLEIVILPRHELHLPELMERFQNVHGVTRIDIAPPITPAAGV